MSFNKFKNNSNCVGGKLDSATTNFCGDIAQNKKNWNTSKTIKRYLFILLKK